MHHVLHLQEILLNIFGHCAPTTSHWNPHRRRSTAALSALARTCRTFKEPALDVLWTEMIDLTPLARCIPESASRCGISGTCYSFKRRPNEAEWDILQGYSRRIWHIFDHASPDGWLDIDSLVAICDPPVVVPLFPNLRTLHWRERTLIPAVHIAVPLLTTLHLNFLPGDMAISTALKDFLDTVGTLCPNIRHYQICVPHPRLFDGTICSHIRHLTNLKEFSCSGVILDPDIIFHLSGIPTLTHLSIFSIPDVSNWTLSSGSAFVFSSLVHMQVGSQLLETITGLLPCVRLPVAEDLDGSFSTCPSKATFRLYTKTLPSVCSSNSLTKVKIFNMQYPTISSEPYRLTLDDIRPCMGFVNLRQVHINLEWSVDLTDSDLLALVSAWPHIHTLRINNEWGWRTTGGITPQGLLQLFQKRRSLYVLCIAIHTASFTDPPHGFETGFHPPLWPLAIDLADSPIRPADVPALVDIFVKLGLRAYFSAWCGMNMEEVEGAFDYRSSWDQVFGLVSEKFLELYGEPDPLAESEIPESLIDLY